MATTQGYTSGQESPLDDLPPWKRELILRKRANVRIHGGFGLPNAVAPTMAGRGSLSGPTSPTACSLSGQQQGVLRPLSGPGPSSPFPYPGNTLSTHLDSARVGASLVAEGTKAKHAIISEVISLPPGTMHHKGLHDAGGPRVASPTYSTVSDSYRHNEDEELSYGPGIVSKLKNRYMSLAMRETRSRPSLRRFSSLEDLLDSDPVWQPEKDVGPTTKGPHHHHPQDSSASRRREVMRRARSVDSLSSRLALESDRGTYSSSSSTTRGRSGNSGLPKSKSASSRLQASQNPLVKDDVIIIEAPKPEKALNGTGKPVEASELPPLTRKLSGSSLAEEEDMPPPDTVRQVKRIFESSGNKSLRGTAAKVAVHKGSKSNGLSPASKPALKVKPTNVPPRKVTPPQGPSHSVTIEEAKLSLKKVNQVVRPSPRTTLNVRASTANGDKKKANNNRKPEENIRKSSENSSNIKKSTEVKSKKYSSEESSITSKKYSSEESSITSKKYSSEESSIPSKKYSSEESSITSKKYSSEESSIPSKKYSSEESSIPSKTYPSEESSVPSKTYPSEESSVPNKNYPSEETTTIKKSPSGEFAPEEFTNSSSKTSPRLGLTPMLASVTAPLVNGDPNTKPRPLGESECSLDETDGGVRRVTSTAVSNVRKEGKVQEFNFAAGSAESGLVKLQSAGVLHGSSGVSSVHGSAESGFVKLQSGGEQPKALSTPKPSSPTPSPLPSSPIASHRVIPPIGSGESERVLQENLKNAEKSRSKPKDSQKSQLPPSKVDTVDGTSQNVELLRSYPPKKVEIVESEVRPPAEDLVRSQVRGSLVEAVNTNKIGASSNIAVKQGVISPSAPSKGIVSPNTPSKGGILSPSTPNKSVVGPNKQSVNSPHISATTKQGLVSPSTPNKQGLVSPSTPNKQGLVSPSTPKQGNISPSKGVGGVGTSPNTTKTASRDRWHQQENTTLVFNFTGNKKETPDYIENDGVDLSRRRPETKQLGSGYVIMPGWEGRQDSSTDGEDLDDDDTPGCDYLDSRPGVPPPPSGIVFLGEAVIINGRSTLQRQPKTRKMKISFDDSLTSTYEYPSENSLLEEAGILPSTPNPALSSSDTPNANQGGLASYTSSKIQIGSTFELGVSRTTAPPHAPPPPPQRAAEEEDEYLRPAQDSETVTWSAESTSDMLF